MRLVEIHKVLVEPHLPPEGELYLMVCLCEVDGVLEKKDIWSDELDWSYNIVTHTKTKLEPYRMWVQ